MDVQSATEMSAQTAKAFESVSALVSQLITLATGIIAVTITFKKDIVPQGGPARAGYIKAAWLLYVLSVLFGILAMQAIAGIYGRGHATAGVYQMPLSGFVAAQVWLFLFATLFVVIFGWTSMNVQRASKKAGAEGAEGRKEDTP